jgi:endonuclease-3 related protein
MKLIIHTYQKLLNNYGPQGWWPLLDLHDKAGVNPTKTGSVKGYHPGDYSYPKNEKQRFEIMVGAVLTQNTAWPNVEKALVGLKKAKLLDPKRLIKKDKEIIKELIKPAGYFNQKCFYLLNISRFFVDNQGKTPTRKALLEVKGIGNETADSILLYAYNQPEFVVDAYTKRIFSDMIIGLGYMEIKELFEKNIPSDNNTVQIYQEYHALIVEHAKRIKEKD